MNNEIKSKFEYRQALADNVDALIKYGNNFQKDKKIEQLSLFDSEMIEIKKVDINVKELSDDGLISVAEKELEATGYSFTYDKFSEYTLIEKTLCTSDMRTIVLTPNIDGYWTIIATVDDVIKKTSKAGNTYYTVKLSRHGMKQEVFLFGQEISQNLSSIKKGAIHIVRINIAGSTYAIKKIQPCDSINVQSYVKNVIIELNDNSNIISLRNIIHFRMKDDSGVNLIVKYNENPIDSFDMKCKITDEICNDIIDCNCKILIERI